MTSIDEIRVPWNASWTGEEEFEVRNCRWVGGKPAVWQKHAPGVGQPIFAKPHMVRQRRSIAEMRCTVCGEKTPTDDRWWFRLGRIDDQTQTYMTTEAPVHKACADHARKVCPHLRSLGVDPQPMPGGYQIMSALVAGHKVREDFNLSLSKDRPVIGAMKIAWPLSAVLSRKQMFALEIL